MRAMRDKLAIIATPKTIPMISQKDIDSHPLTDPDTDIPKERKLSLDHRQPSLIPAPIPPITPDGVNIQSPQSKVKDLIANAKHLKQLAKQVGKKAAIRTHDGALDTKNAVTESAKQFGEKAKKTMVDTREASKHAITSGYARAEQFTEGAVRAALASSQHLKEKIPKPKPDTEELSIINTINNLNTLFSRDELALIHNDMFRAYRHVVFYYAQASGTILVEKAIPDTLKSIYAKLHCTYRYQEYTAPHDVIVVSMLAKILGYLHLTLLPMIMPNQVHQIHTAEGLEQLLRQKPKAFNRELAKIPFFSKDVIRIRFQHLIGQEVTSFSATQMPVATHEIPPTAIDSPFMLGDPSGGDSTSPTAVLTPLDPSVNQLENATRNWCNLFLGVIAITAAITIVGTAMFCAPVLASLIVSFGPLGYGLAASVCLSTAGLFAAGGVALNRSHAKETRFSDALPPSST